MFPAVVPVAGMSEAQPPLSAGGEQWLHKAELCLLCSFTHHRVMFRVTELLGLERAFKGHPVQPPAMDRDNFN